MEKATHSSTLAWKIPWTEEPGGLQSMGSPRVGYDWATSLSLFTFMHWRRKRQPTPVFLPGESQGRAEPGRLPSMGSHRVRHDWSELAAAAAAAYWKDSVVKLQFTSKGTEKQNVNSKRNFPNHNCPEMKRAASCRDEFPVTVTLVLWQSRGVRRQRRHSCTIWKSLHFIGFLVKFPGTVLKPFTM